MGAQAHRPPPRIALIDGNSFYCACERVLRPSLEGKPVIVLSNNDGCAIARTAEAKAMGIPMGAPWFSIRHLQARGLVAISANFALYGDMSDRMMRVIGQFSPAQEIYSIDECFLDLTGLPGTGREIGTRIRQRVLRWVGIPTCVGIGATKTLAKLANHLAKSLPRLQGVCDLSGLNHAGLLRAIRHVPVGDVWGVGRRLAPSLEASGIRTAADLARADRHELRRRYSIVLAKTARELCGEPAIGWEDAPSPKQQIMSTRSFGRPVRDLTELEQAVSLFTSRAAEKLRQQHSHASVVQVYIRTSRFRTGPWHADNAVVPLDRPTDHTSVLLKAALAGLRSVFRPGFDYAKAGVCLLDVRPAAAGPVQGELFGQDPEYMVRSSRAMAVVDQLNQRFGSRMIQVASALHEPDARWLMRQAHRSPSYTTQWGDVVKVG
ncbi:translesion error-prone DNA polymerase V subunit UmuC [Castellaniella daejeonensis]|jgi:DNA polymerase V|uniref:Translesion error-prone DNA polymerase V subunit UmuC n=1 Tax=Castellaniella daejeonensis TaxID=659013 RepID=A0ABN0U4A2_9BURK|nr:Y-family DNA polymerase [Castellaniella sp.]HET8702631.1 Y-family DNA polymerase [Castellaniella sp.]